MTEKKKFNYAQAMGKIQEILKKIESEHENIDIDTLIVEVEEAADLIRECKEKLFKAEAKIQTILSELDKDADSQS